jgi:hypothetical protein
MGRALRIESNPSSAITNLFVYDGNQVVADLDASGNLLRSYTWGPGIDNLLSLTVWIGGPGATPAATTPSTTTITPSLRWRTPPEPSSKPTSTTPGATRRSATRRDLKFQTDNLKSETAASGRGGNTITKPGSITSAPAGTIQKPAAGSLKTPSEFPAV